MACNRTSQPANNDAFSSRRSQQHLSKGQKSLPEIWRVFKRNKCEELKENGACSHTHCANLIVRHEKDTTIKRSARGSEIARTIRVAWRGELAGTRWMWKESIIATASTTASSLALHKANKKVHEHPCACEYVSECTQYNWIGGQKDRTNRKDGEQNSTTKRNKRKTVNLCGY